MSTTPHISPVEAETLTHPDNESIVSDAAMEASPPWDEDEPAGPARSLAAYLPMAAALIAITGWSAFFGWTNREAMLAGAGADRWAGWISGWSVPVVLVIAIWLLAMRNSRREASRFADAGQALATEASRLEDRLSAVNRELSLAREFITAQSRDLESLGRLASERLSEHAGKLEELVQHNGAQVEAIASVSVTALENMGKLRSDLPVIANSARDTANQIGNAGRTAQKQLERMVEGMDRLNQFGKASEQQVDLVQAKVAEALGEFTQRSEALARIAEDRFAAFAAQGEEFRATLDAHEVEALAAIGRRAEALFAELRTAREELAIQETTSLEHLHGRISTLRDEGTATADALGKGEIAALSSLRDHIGELAALTAQFDATLEDRNRSFRERIDQLRQENEVHDAAEIERVEQSLAQFDERIAALREKQTQINHDVAAEGEQLARRLEALQREMDRIAAQGSEVRGSLSEGVAHLGEALAQGRQSLDGTEQQVSLLTDASVRLLELIHASAQHSQEALPLALGASENRLAEFKVQSEAIAQIIREAGDEGGRLAALVGSVRSEGQASIEEFASFHEAIATRTQEHAEKIAHLRAELADLMQQNEEQARQASDELTSLLSGLQQSTGETLDQLASGANKLAATLASEISLHGTEVIDQFLQEQTANASAKLEAAAIKASTLGREAALQLRDQLGRVDELTSHLEARVNHARQRAEEQADNDFSRRVALITESLNSNAIDIASALSHEVTDTAWASYLKGDRGIFTRRAVRLLDTTQIKAITEIYEQDPDFREHVSRYVHDFEAMMRTLLSTRDGHALSVTLLSSDMGKLYVILAQAIDRLRN